VALAATAATILAGCGASSNSNPLIQHGAPNQPTPPVVLHGHGQAVNPVAGNAPQVNQAPAGAGGSPSVSVGPAAAGGGALAQPVSNAQVEAELSASGISADPNRATLTPSGLAIAPVNAPLVVQEVINAANQIARLPYRFGGGHGTFEDTAYDCSGSLSFVFASAGLLNTTETSGQLMSYGDAGPGKWITIFANQGHTFAYIAGLRFDTVALAETGSRWSNRGADESNLGSFAIRHPAGL
jgi:hypothetical protein